MPYKPNDYTLHPMSMSVLGMMVDLLSRYTNMSVVQVTDAMVVAPNHIYMIPPNKDLTINNGELFISVPARPRGLRLPIDSFFCSLAEDQRERASCIVLSGTGSDGTLGLKAIKSYGGMAMVQAPDDAQYDGMPVSAVSTGIVDYVLPVSKMADVLVKYIQHAYKRNTLIRRIKRRISLKQLDSMEEYVGYLRDHPDETVELFKDMLIGVTSFFRDPESWDILESKFLASLEKHTAHSLRIWVPGCPTGEEAYSMAIQLLEFKKKHNLNLDFQIFATDIDINALEIARTGIYPESIATSLAPQRLKKIFSKSQLQNSGWMSSNPTLSLFLGWNEMHGGSMDRNSRSETGQRGEADRRSRVLQLARKEDEFYKVAPTLRDSIVFSEQNLISDPPFSRLDLVSCRNLLIYLQLGIQSKIIDLFHFALNPRSDIDMRRMPQPFDSSDIPENHSSPARLCWRNMCRHAS